MILKNDKITFKVFYKFDGEMFKREFNTLEDAYKHFENLKIIAFLDFTASSKGSSVTASLYVRTKDGRIETIHQHYLDKIKAVS